MSAYTLSDLVDLSLLYPEPGTVNFNMLHTVLRTLLDELGLEKVRPSLGIEHPLLSKIELSKARLLAKKTRSQGSLQQSTSGEASSKPPSSVPKEQSGPEQSGPKQSGPEQSGPEQSVAEQSGPEQSVDASAEFTYGKAEKGWKYTKLEARVLALEEAMYRITETLDTLIDKFNKAEAKKKIQGGSSPEELEELYQRMEKLEQTLKTYQEDSKKKSGGASSTEFEELEDRIEELEEAKLIFDQDHETLGQVLNVQKEMMQEFEEIKALGNDIKDMKNEIALKAGIKEMEEALDLKGDLSLVQTKVDQLEFETAIEELGEAIGLLGIKFTKKGDEWEERCAEVRTSVEKKMSREVFDAEVLKIESRLTALMYALKTMKKVLEELLYPDSSGVTRCILCRRPAAISRHECWDVKDLPKRPHKSSEGSSNESVTLDKFLEDVAKATAKKPKMDGPPFAAQRDPVLRIPYSSSTYRTKEDGKAPLKEPQLKLAPVSEKSYQGKSEDEKNLGKPQVYKSSMKSSTKKVQIKVPKQDPRLPHNKLIFTDKILEEYNRQEEEEQKKDSNSSPSETISASTPPREESPASEATDVMSDSVRNMESFAPMRLMEDPLRREIIRSPNARNSETPRLSLAPLYPDSTSSHDSKAS